MSNVMRRSPRRLGCLGYGSPSLVTRFLELGLITSLHGTVIVRPSMVGTLRLVPTKAWKIEEKIEMKKKIRLIYLYTKKVCFKPKQEKKVIWFIKLHVRKMSSSKQEGH